MFQLFQILQALVPNVSFAFLDVRCKCTYLDVAYVSRICCKSMFEMFQLFQSYVAISVFMLQVFYLDVAYVSYTCCKCMFQMFHLL